MIQVSDQSNKLTLRAAACRGSRPLDFLSPRRSSKNRIVRHDEVQRSAHQVHWPLP